MHRITPGLLALVTLALPPPTRCFADPIPTPVGCQFGATSTAKQKQSKPKPNCTNKRNIRHRCDKVPLSVQRPLSHAFARRQGNVGRALVAACNLQPGNPGGIDLVGLDIPQVPRNVFTWEARYWNPSRLLLSMQGRFIGRQFDDDQNLLPLDSFHAMDLELGRDLARHVQVFAAAENVLDERYQVARTPVVNLGPPILFRVGLRLNFPAKK